MQHYLYLQNYVILKIIIFLNLCFQCILQIQSDLHHLGGPKLPLPGEPPVQVSQRLRQTLEISFKREKTLQESSRRIRKCCFLVWTLLGHLCNWSRPSAAPYNCSCWSGTNWHFTWDACTLHWGSEYRTRGQTPNGPVLECYLNPGQPDHFNTRQMNSSKGLGFFTSEAPPLSQHIMRAGQLGALVKYTSRLEANKPVSHQ